VKALSTILTLLVVPAVSGAEQPIPNLEIKRGVVDSIERDADTLAALSDEIWAYAEVALRETRSARALADYAEAQGFEVVRGVAGMATAFVASYGQGRPMIGVLGEYDALPGLSQAASVTQSPLEEGAAGHGCGHNLFGAGSLGAAAAIKRLIEAGTLRGTVRFYGTPAEETIGGKIYMARDGLFDDLDVVLAWHPGFENKIDTESSLAMVEFFVDFKGEPAHAAYDPWNGRSALDGLELFTHAVNLAREHVKPTVRMHYTISNGGGVPNVVPMESRAWVWVRDEQKESVDALLERIEAMAEGAALATGVEVQLSVVSGAYNLLINTEAAKVMQASMEWLGDIEFSDEEQGMARALQRATGTPEKGLDGRVTPLDLDPVGGDRGSTDVADVSWVVPTVDVTITAVPKDIPWHAWGVVAASGSAMGHRGMLHAAKVLATTMVDLYTSPEIIHRIRDEFDRQTAGHTYEPYVPAGPPPTREKP
jgi:aminobenzoyl-glutamate utilization protein B